MGKIKEVIWMFDVEEHDYPAAESYLLLLFDEKTVATIVKKLREAPVVEFKAKDVFRASTLSLLGVSNLHVDKDRKKILKGKPLSPLLLVRDAATGMDIIECVRFMVLTKIP